ncbi:hypothetical protein DMUE_1329 [Dictyocoela muelleri]|nr:hypothetical protein DMUE_1329 [Dictyocoela muelleri]
MYIYRSLIILSLNLIFDIQHVITTGSSDNGENQRICAKIICRDSEVVELSIDFCQKFEYLRTLLNKENDIIEINEENYQSIIFEKIKNITANSIDIDIDGEEFFDILNIMSKYKPIEKYTFFSNIVNSSINNIPGILDFYEFTDLNKNEYKNIDPLFWYLFLDKISRKSCFEIKIINDVLIIDYDNPLYEFINLGTENNNIAEKVKTVLIRFPRVECTYKKIPNETISFIIHQLLTNKSYKNKINTLELCYIDVSVEFINLMSYFKEEISRIKSLNLLNSANSFDLSYTPILIPENYDYYLIPSSNIHFTDIICNETRLDTIIDEFIRKFKNLETIKLEIYSYYKNIVQFHFLKNESVREKLSILSLKGNLFDLKFENIYFLTKLKNLTDLTLLVKSPEEVVQFLNILKNKDKIIRLAVFRDVYSDERCRESIEKFLNLNEITLIEKRNCQSFIKKTYGNKY